jgi:hypothetical protein
MKIHEYQAKEIFSKYGIPVERHTLCRTAAGVLAAYRRMGTDRVVIKAQVLTGGRGKAGGVKLVNNTEDAYQEAKNILGMSIKGLPVNQVLVSEAVDIAAEYYVSYTIDRNTRTQSWRMSAFILIRCTTLMQKNKTRATYYVSCTVDRLHRQTWQVLRKSNTGLDCPAKKLVLYGIFPLRSTKCNT